MLFKDSIVIDAPPDKVWEYLGSPDLWSLFHAKTGKCEQTSSQGGRIGSVYTIEFRLGAKTTPTRCEIVDLQPGEKIQVQSTITDPNDRATAATLTYELEDLGARTRVRERVEYVIPKLGIGWRAIIWFISRFGHRVGESTLMKLKKVVEGDTPVGTK